MTRLTLFVCLLVCLAAGLVLQPLLLPHASQIARAGAAWQTGGENTWSPPINLSNSGGSSNPKMAVDAAGGIHVVYTDEFSGLNYTHFVDGAWTDPVVVDLPFKEVVPVLVASEGYIHAFWINTTRDNMLMHSRVEPDKFAEPGSWESSKPISKYVVGFDVVSSGAGLFNLLYIHSIAEKDRPEGIIYQRSKDEGQSWSDSVLLYPSRYYRSVTPDQANVQLSITKAGEQEIVSASWDNAGIKRIFFTRSLDGGATWGEAAEIDGPEADNVTGIPFKIKMITDEQRVMLVWQGNLQSGLFCTQYYQFSSDGGETWSSRKEMLQGITGCADNNELMRMADGAFTLATSIRGQIYLLAWNGERWSEPQIQNLLSTFDNPVTGIPVIYRCHQFVMQPDNSLLVVGCDDAEGKDIWFTSTQLGAVDTWFPPASKWSEPRVLTSTTQEIFSTQGFYDPHGTFHLFWVQVEEARETGAATNFRSVFYTGWDGEQNTSPGMIIRSPDKYVEDLSVAYDVARDRLVVAWSAGKTGLIYYSWADVARSFSALEWSEPVAIPLPAPLGRWPAIQVRSDGVIFVAYAIPVNEGRGIYMVSSSDSGETWSAPVKVFDAGSAGWQAVGGPKMTLVKDSSIQLVWAQDSVFAGSESVALYHSRSLDSGATWSEPAAAFSEPVSAWWISNAGAAGVQRFWIGTGAEKPSLFTDVSTDEGVTWSLPTNLTGLGQTLLEAAPSGSLNGQLSLAQIVQPETGRLILQNMGWAEGAWRPADALTLDETAQDTVGSAAIDTSAEGHISVAYVSHKYAIGTDSNPWEIVFLDYNPAGPTPGTGVLTTPTAAVSAPQATVAATAETAATPAVGDATPEQTEPPAGATGQASPAAALGTPTPTRIVLTGDTTEVLPQVDSTVVGMILGGGISLLVVIGFVAFARLRRRN